jgi:O-methyltransferase/aklanonic acid methyltransferase
MQDPGREHKALVARLFGELAPTYAAAAEPFWHFGRRLIERLAPQPGAHLLDVATGRGAVLIPAAQAIGPAGLAIGVDLTPSMVHQTGRQLARQAIGNARVGVMDAEALAFPAACFDGVTCAFTLNLLPNRDQALEARPQNGHFRGGWSG